MQSAIKDIFHGRKGDVETMRMPASHYKNSGQLDNLYNELMRKLSPELAKLHQQYTDMLEIAYVEEVDFYFAEGFKLGIRIGIECATD